MTLMVTAPEDNRNFFILKPLLEEAVKELVMCQQMKLLAMRANETYPFF
jgi:hypothetical protein